MTHILFHIPHSSLKIPKKFWNVCIRDEKYIKESNEFLCDYLVNKLAPPRCNKLFFKYSRLFCDVEKYVDDSKEVMSKKGMGVIYTNDCDNTITVLNSKYKYKVLKSYYFKYHNKLNKVVSNIVRKYNRCIIVDLHSFSPEMVKKLFGNNNNPDICIGTTDFFTNEKLLAFTIKHFKKYGYSVEINNPYSGTIVPNKYINKKTSQVKSIMIEINKKIYLDNEFNFYKLKNCIDDYYKKLQSL